MPVIKHPIVTEKSSMLMERENSLQFAVDVRATKKQIKKEVEETFGVKVKSIRTLTDPKGTKKAIVRLEDEYRAEDLLTRLGIF